MPVRPMLLHHMSLVSFLLFCKNLGNLQQFFGQMVYRPPWPKIARTPMNITLKDLGQNKIEHHFRTSKLRLGLGKKPVLKEM